MFVFSLLLLFNAASAEEPLRDLGMVLVEVATATAPSGGGERLGRFYIMEAEVTQGLWTEVMGSNPSEFSACGATCPVENVSWYDAVSFANALSRRDGLEECYELTGCSSTAGNDLECSSISVTSTSGSPYDCEGYRLPTEAEWEYSSRGGLEGASFSWGEESPNEGKSKANTWQGRFPYNNVNEDGFVGSSPVGCFAANGLGLYDTTGNVWEWTDTAYGPDRKRDYGIEGYDPQQPGVTVKTLKGGSFLCSDNYCQRFRPAARQAQDTTLASSHIGFRTAADILAH